MTKDITLGQYYKTESALHKLDPRTKLFGLLVFIVMVFICNNIYSYLFAGACLIAVVVTSRIPVKLLAKALRAVMFILIITAIFNVFTIKGHTIFNIGIIRITKEGIITTMEVTFRIITIVLASSLLTLSTTPNNLTDGLEKSLKFLNKIKIPVHEIALEMTIALRFIPILAEETDKIKKAQNARGADFVSGGIIRKAKSMLPILIPLFVSAFKRADALALAMDARCYKGGEGRTKMYPLKYGKNDLIAYLYILLAVVVIAILNIVM